MGLLGLDESEIVHLIEYADSDRNGSADYKEFVDLLIKLRSNSASTASFFIRRDLQRFSEELAQMKFRMSIPDYDPQMPVPEPMSIGPSMTCRDSVKSHQSRATLKTSCSAQSDSEQPPDGNIIKSRNDPAANFPKFASIPTQDLECSLQSAAPKLYNFDKIPSLGSQCSSHSPAPQQNNAGTEGCSIGSGSANFRGMQQLQPRASSCSRESCDTYPSEVILLGKQEDAKIMSPLCSSIMLPGTFSLSRPYQTNLL